MPEEVGMNAGTSSAAKRFQTAFSALRKAGRGGLVTYLTAGDPDPLRSTALAIGAARAGSAMLEIGMPSDDPWLDGPAIQAAQKRAAAAGASMQTAFDLVWHARQNAPGLPIVLMGYAAPCRAYGIEGFFADAAASGADGVLIVDADAAERPIWGRLAVRQGLCFIPIALADMGADGWHDGGPDPRGFLYAVAAPGRTGGAPPSPADVARRVAALRAVTALPIVAGFGIRTFAMAQEIAGIADAVAVGSLFAEEVARGLKRPAPTGVLETTLGAVRALVKSCDMSGRGPSSGG